MKIPNLEKYEEKEKHLKDKNNGFLLHLNYIQIPENMIVYIKYRSDPGSHDWAGSETCLI